MKNKRKHFFAIFFVFFAIAFLGSFTQKAEAMVPSLSLYTAGNNSVQINVNGDPNATITLYYYINNGGSITSSYLGSTDQNGYFSITVNASAYNIWQNSSVYVNVNGFQSNTVVWPYNTNNNGYYNYNNNYQNYTNTSPVSLSQSSVSLGLGQTVNVGVTGGTGIYYVASNGNQNIASIATNGNNVEIYGRQSGSSQAVICSSVQNGYSSNSNGYTYNSCANLLINVGLNTVYNYIPTYSYIPQAPYASAVTLSQVPYTGAELTPGMILFIACLWIWSAALAYLVYRKMDDAVITKNW